ncbi:potassium channel family protein [Ralstonia pseudosolanacearum]|uniref:Potassium channel domain-containing protein n=1 Tax=Ralstonia solanacearum TaxID=305 RepID=A0A0S4V2E3_RALSL|nr:potassium channel family protein [Ralstonia pseudosolanacearum]OIN68950.1 hypothetical protein BL247_23550 [Ralstonia solanacearum]MCK4143550.1 two pore domain potassium channel family protein [Ralstonia pseudosolanacearum]QWF62110.1 potassium channel family protein [Ralstonia solanacearum]CUV28835.1 membrane protein of unknown function [Ralstonia solanacearum]BCM01763.1 hypothetical protein MAFF301560_11500 [Ralstonia solanacearum]
MEGGSVDKIVDTLANRRLTHMVVQSRPRVWRDARANTKWVLVPLGLILLWAFVSAAISVNCGLIYSPQPTTSGAPKVLDYGGALYFTFINMTTVGFGDIYPISAGARVLAVVNAILGIVMFALVTGALVLSLSPADEDEEAADDLDGNDAGPLTPEPFQDGRLAELRKSDAFVWSQIGELVAIIAAARELVPSEGPVAEPLSSSMASLHGLLHNRKTQSLLAEALYARSRLAHAVYDLALDPKNTAPSHLPKI